jgi:hypothetical protein
VFLGEGDDTFLWSPGDSSDVVEGEAGSDALIFSTSGANETIDLHANGSRVNLFRNIASTTTDLDGIERIEVHTFGGSDVVVVNPLTGTSAAQVDVDLPATHSDTVVVNGAPGSDPVEVGRGQRGHRGWTRRHRQRGERRAGDRSDGGERRRARRQRNARRRYDAHRP